MSENGALEELIGEKKVDLAFFKSYLKVKTYFLRKVIYQALLFVLSVAVQIYILAAVQSQIGIFSIQILISSFLYFILILVFYRMIVCNFGYSLLIAQNTGHLVRQIGGQNPIVSLLVYNAITDMRADDFALTNEVMNLTENNISGIIKNLLKSWHPCKNYLLPMTQLYTLVIFVVGIVQICKNEYSDQDQTILICLIVISGLNSIKFIIGSIVVGIIIGLIPIVLIFGCFYYCCCYKPVVVKIPEPQRASISMISQTNECSICMRNFQVDQNLIVLPCSEKHIFHEVCIATWTKLNPSCPICRHGLIE